MNKKAKFLLLSSLLCFGVLSVATLPFVSSSLQSYQAENSVYLFEGNAERNRFLPEDSGEGTGTSLTNLGNQIRWEYSNASSNLSCWAKLGKGGRIGNLDAIHGITSISLTLQNASSALIIRFGGSKEYTSSHYFSYAQTNGNIVFDFKGKAPNHFEIYAVEETEIASISLRYSCGDSYVDLHLSSSDTLRGEVRGGGKCLLGEQATIVALPRLGMSFEGWYEAEQLISKEATYSLPIDRPRSLEARFSGDLTLLDSYSYGAYPQSVANEEIEKALTLLAPEKDGTYRYQNDIYLRLEANPYSYGAKTFDNGTIVEKGRSYFFKMEPITWKVLSKNADGSYLLLSEKVLDATSYYYDENDRQMSNTFISPNHYGYSNLRSFLNGYNGVAYSVDNYEGKGFLQRAFSLKEQDHVLFHEVDNSPNTTFHPNNAFTCENTEDAIFPLSYVDYENKDYGFSTNDSTKQRTLGTDYANALGLALEVDWRTANYWTRSPNPVFGTQASIVMMNGYLGDSTVETSYYGVRPAMRLNFQ